MKLNIYNSILYILLLTYCSCSKTTTNNVSTVTVFPEIKLIGKKLITQEQGALFIDQGAIATVNGKTIDYKVTGSLDINKTGFYTLNYIAKNTEGFEAKVTRTIIVYQNNNTIAGVYMGRRIDKGIPSPILITSNNNNFDCTDIAGGYYEQSTNQFGPAYGADAIISIDNNTIKSTGSIIEFGPIQMSNGSISLDKRTLNWTVTLTDFDFSFDVELNKITP